MQIVAHFCAFYTVFSPFWHFFTFRFFLRLVPMERLRVIARSSWSRVAREQGLSITWPGSKVYPSQGQGAGVINHRANGQAYLPKYWGAEFTTGPWSRAHLWQGQVAAFITVFRCLSPFKIGINISLKQSVWADLSWNPFKRRIASICFGPNHSGKKFQAKIWIFAQVIFNFSSDEIGFFGLTWRVTLL